MQRVRDPFSVLACEILIQNLWQVTRMSCPKRAEIKHYKSIVPAF